MKITVDTKGRVIYDGRVSELLQYELVQSLAFEDAPEFRLLRRLLSRIAPLHLIDPTAPDFTPQGCRSVHDVIRFIHEKAVEELMDLPGLVKRFKGVHIFTLVSDMPLGLKILGPGRRHRPRSYREQAPPGTDPLRAPEGAVGRALRPRGLEHRAHPGGFQGDDVQPLQDLGRNAGGRHRFRVQPGGDHRNLYESPPAAGLPL